MPDRTDHRSVVVRLLHHHNIDSDGFESVMFHFDQAVETARMDGRDEALREAIDRLEQGLVAADCEETLS